MCGTRMSVRKGTFFEKSKLHIHTILQIMFDFVSQTPVTTSANFSGVSTGVAIQWFEYCRDICTSKLLKDKKKLGGTGHIVEVDESLLFKRKNNVGRVSRQEWVIGFYDRTAKLGFLRQIPDRTAVTLEAAILENVEPGSTIFTDEWRSYSRLTSLGYQHGTVNHSEHFVDPVTGVCTNSIEGYWSRIKRKVKHVSGSVGNMKWSHVDEAMYREAYGMKTDTAIRNFNLFLTHVTEKYPV